MKKSSTIIPNQTELGRKHRQMLVHHIGEADQPRYALITQFGVRRIRARVARRILKDLGR